MKLALSILLIFVCTFSQAQKKGRGFMKFEPGLFMPEKQDAIPGILGSFGIGIGRFINGGIGSGYYKLKGTTKPVIPFGIDFTFCDFEKKKITPLMFLSAYYPAYNTKERFVSNTNTSVTLITIQGEGKFMYRIGAGIAASYSKRGKCLVSVGYSELNTSYITNSQITISGNRSQSKKEVDVKTKMAVIAIGVVI